MTENGQAHEGQFTDDDQALEVAEGALMLRDDSEIAMARFEPPEDAEILANDVAGYWHHRIGEPVSFIPRSIVLTDSGQNPEKSSALLIGTLLSPAHLIVEEELDDGEADIQRTVGLVEAGENVGIWVKPGMSGLLHHRGHAIWMATNGRRAMKVKGHNKMWAFKIARLKQPGETEPPPPAMIELQEDRRKTSVAELIDERLKNREGPWWLKVLPDGGLQQAKAAYKARQAQANAMMGGDSPVADAPA